MFVSSYFIDWKFWCLIPTSNFLKFLFTSIILSFVPSACQFFDPFQYSVNWPALHLTHALSSKHHSELGCFWVYCWALRSYLTFLIASNHFPFALKEFVCFHFQVNLTLIQGYKFCHFCHYYAMSTDVLEFGSDLVFKFVFVA